MKVASRLVPGEGRDLIVGDHKRDFRTFQKELATIGTKNFANGSVATKLQWGEDSDFFEKSRILGDSETVRCFGRASAYDQ